MLRYAGTVEAPDFPSGLDWLNAARSISIKELSGKVVLLDFWTYSSINCLSIIPDLKRLERKYRGELVVIGVHSAKFETERKTRHVRQAVLRYGVKHPVLNDPGMVLWRQYGIHAWPTVAVIDPQNKVVGSISGEAAYEPLDQVIHDMIADFDSRRMIDRRGFDVRPDPDPADPLILSFPGKLVADSVSDRLFIADSGHNRIVLAGLEPEGEILDVVGSGQTGLVDGGFEDCAFNHPQGMALDGELLYVADVGNHAVRMVDFGRRCVQTLAGNGTRRRPLHAVEQLATSTPLSSPFDVELAGGSLWVAMAGSHQVWRLDLEEPRIDPWIGSGAEGRIDGPWSEAALAEPSGITTDGARLYVVDSETSSIRAATVGSSERVDTIVGVDLFEFGDQDGFGDEVRLQHPLGIAISEGILYVADTYNNKIKKIFPKTRAAVTLAGGLEAGHRDGDKPLFDEPGDISVWRGYVYVADTNNHAIRVIDIQTGRTHTVSLRRVEDPGQAIVAR